MRKIFNLIVHKRSELMTYRHKMHEAEGLVTVLDAMKATGPHNLFRYLDQ